MSYIDENRDFQNNIAMKELPVKTEREFGPDCIRISAFCLLLWLHFYLRNGFYHSAADGFWGFLAVMFRPVFMCCIPLFLMLTGYLKCGKSWTDRYYRSNIAYYYKLCADLGCPSGVQDFMDERILNGRGMVL